MRPFLSILIAVVLLAGIYAYTSFANRVRPDLIVYQADFSAAQYSIRLHRTFDCEGNPEFGLPTSLELIFKTERIIQREDKVSATEMLLVDLPNVEIGRNVVEVIANLPATFTSDFEEDFGDDGFADPEARTDAMLIELLRNGNVIEQATFWVEPGLNSISGSLYFEIDDDPSSEESP